VITDRKILLTGTRGIAQAVARLPYAVTAVSRSTGHDIADWRNWIDQFKDHDVFVNNAQSNFFQTELLVHMALSWKNRPDKLIINIGSMVADYRRSVGADDEFWQYRLEKQNLQSAYAKLSRDCLCRVALINPGAVDTDMVRDLDCAKMHPDTVAKYVDMVIQNPELRRIDLWL
jgi:NAD(P)-dependent dehydrogenase (short-subunit alcohol dehydrogenase family)